MEKQNDRQTYRDTHMHIQVYIHTCACRNGLHTHTNKLYDATNTYVYISYHMTAILAHNEKAEYTVTKPQVYIIMKSPNHTKSPK